MTQLFFRGVLTVLGNALGLLIAALIVDGLSVTIQGFITSVLFFTAAYAILSPFVLKIALRYLPVLSGGIALVTTLVVLILTTLLTSGVRVEGVTAWIVAPSVIWIVTVLAGVVLPLFLFKKALASTDTPSPKDA